MVDRLEELLALLEEEDGEEREDAPALRLGTEVPASPVPKTQTEKEPEYGWETADPALDEERVVLARAETLEWLPDAATPAPKRRDEIPGTSGGAEAGPAGDSAAENGTEEFWWDGLTAAVMGRNGTVVLRKPGGGDVELTEPDGAAVEPAAARQMEAAADTMTAAERGLEGLYRQTVQAGRPVSQALPVEQAGRTVRAEEPGRTAALTVDELDRAVRRDSRRYDGGMTIF